MRKFKKVIASIMAAASVMTCMAMSASAATVSIKKGDAGSQANIIGAKQVHYTGQCSNTAAVFRLAYSSGSYLIDVDNFTLFSGYSFDKYSPVYDTGKMWTYQVLATGTNNLTSVASGTIEAMMY